MAESFFSTLDARRSTLDARRSTLDARGSRLEAELLSRRRFASQAEAKMACFSYIEG